MEKIISLFVVVILLQQAIAVNVTLGCSRAHEIYNTCGTACPPTCDNYNNPPMCTDQCVAGCYCEYGYVRNSEQNCVKPSECPQVSRCTRSHEIYNACGTACPLTCANYKNPPICTAQCVAGCFCEKVYVRDSAMNCVKPDECTT